MVEQQTKNKLLLFEMMIVVGLMVFVGAFALDKMFPTARVVSDTDNIPIVGFVPVEIKSQPIEIFADKPSAFLLFTEKENAFNLTAFRISGEVTGTGRAEILLDNGLGQELLIHSNIRQKQGNLITGMAVDDGIGEPLPKDAKIEPVDANNAWLIIAPQTELQVEGPVTELEDSKRTEAGAFQYSCIDTCYMNMKLQKGLYYLLKIRVDAETNVRINELKYMLEV